MKTELYIHVLPTEELSTLRVDLLRCNISITCCFTSFPWYLITLFCAEQDGTIRVERCDISNSFRLKPTNDSILEGKSNEPAWLEAMVDLQGSRSTWIVGDLEGDGRGKDLWQRWPRWCAEGGGERGRVLMTGTFLGCKAGRVFMVSACQMEKSPWNPHANGYSIKAGLLPISVCICNTETANIHHHFNFSLNMMIVHISGFSILSLTPPPPPHTHKLSSLTLGKDYHWTSVASQSIWPDYLLWTVNSKCWASQRTTFHYPCSTYSEWRTNCNVKAGSHKSTHHDTSCHVLSM